MPEAGRTPEPAFERGSGPDALDYGDAAQANALMGFVDEAELDDEGDVFVPSGEEEDFIFGPSGRPDEPITQGAPFGAGSDFLRSAYESDEAFTQRIASQIANAPSSPGEARGFARRLLEGE
jgi:hypothetical protein